MKTGPLSQSPESAQLNPAGKPHRRYQVRQLFGLLAGCYLLVASHPVPAYESRGARSCVEWQEYRQDKVTGHPQNAEIYETWLVGYLSGVVAGAGTDFLVGTDNEVVFQMVDVYCGANLLMNLATAGTYVARDLMQQKGIVNRGTLP
jgi:hypothetical protein